MARYLSLYRRRPNLIDVNLQSGAGSSILMRANAASYNFQVAANFDSDALNWVTFQNVPVAGYASPSAMVEDFVGEQFSRSRTPYLTRFRFAPSDYTSLFSAAGVSDITPIWLRVVQINADGSTDTNGYPTVAGSVDLNTLNYGPGGDLDGLAFTITYDGSSSTKIAAGSNAVALPVVGGVINVVSTAGFNATGSIEITLTGGAKTVVTYTGLGIGGTTFTGCTGGAGTLHTNNAVLPTVLFNAPSNRGAVITQINDVTYVSNSGVLASINALNELVLTSNIGTGATHNIDIVGDAATLVILGLVAGTTTGATDITEAAHLILPYNPQPNRNVILAGNAPQASSLADSLEIQLPMQVNNIQVQNNTSNINLMVAFEPTGPEFLVNPSTAYGLNFYETYTATSQIFVRAPGSLGAAAFNFVGALRNNPT